MFPELQSAKKAARVKARVRDGDTFAVDIRLLGTDAIEVKQQCQKPDGTCTPCGQGARHAMGQLFERVDGKNGRNGLKVSFTGETTYGRPVATATIDGKDVGETLIRQGWAIAEPRYLAGDPERLRRCTAAEAEARQAKRERSGSSSTRLRSTGAAGGSSANMHANQRAKGRQVSDLPPSRPDLRTYSLMLPATVVKAPLTFVPTLLTAVIIATAIRAAIRPYSIAVAPLLFLMNLRNEIILSPPSHVFNQSGAG
jgi:endonuclease YncB( thermonuclease family)